jgi:hypothetical protein
LFIFEVECGEIENRIIIRSFRRQLNQVILHEQVENGVAIHSKLGGSTICNTYKSFLNKTKTFVDRRKTCKPHNILGSINNFS